MIEIPTALAVILPLLLAVLAAGLGILAGLSIGRARSAPRLAELERSNAALDATVRGYETQLDQAREHTQVAQRLQPIAESLQSLNQRVQQVETQRAQQHGTLSQQLRASLESEERLRASADSLAKALSSSQSRGMWGETQLQRVVESSGMLERVDFDVQANTADGASRPDMVVHLPGDRHLVLDAKAPFDAYLRATALPEGAESADERDGLLTEHARALKGHVDALAKRDYARKVAGGPELVILFLPSEALLSAALDADPALLEHAFGRGVALASPVTLFSVLRAIAASWTQVNVAEDAQRILHLATELYERISTMGGHIERMRGSLEKSVQHFNAFTSTLESRVLVTGRKLDELSAAKSVPTIDQIDTGPRTLTAPEFSPDGR
ncbi:DNA recombination protein RmuC [uncultured Agrococcus sp.]|uniref:DNA recombination protein RmuC n=1 Tax=uncultured Agrococcus sp. TaxID=382258 RepID=UPI0025D006F2|nr:DNA recombination protein RmuC [uncultured Agrococcus sp.]